MRDPVSYDKSMSGVQKDKVVIIGAGPAGLGAAYELFIKNKKNKQFSLRIFDKNTLVGGLARTHFYKGYGFDVGPHRYYTKNKDVMSLWRHIMGTSFVKIPRLTRILYRNKFFNYPVEIKDVLKNLGLIETTLAFFSYIDSKINLAGTEPKTFEEWITKHFGKKLYRMFFKTYTEKVWGIPCSQISAQWAAQRIKNLNFIEVVKNAISPQGNKGKAKSLIDHFWYPTQGSGSMYTKMASFIKENKGKVDLEYEVVAIHHTKNNITDLTVKHKGKKEKIPVDFLFSSMPLTHFVAALRPLPEKNILKAISKLYYRDHITVNLIVNKKSLFPDNWMYIHSPEVKMCRIANYTNFSDKMIGKKNTSAISVEYFTFQKDALWKKSERELIALATKELEKLNLCKKGDVIDGFVVRETESYPTYYLGHQQYFDEIKNYVSRFENLQLIGRGGMYKYNNMDHSIYSGMLAARNYLAGKKVYDVWQVNEEAEYHEEISK